MANVLVWVDIPVLDLDRAIGFYSAILAAPVTKQEHPGRIIGLLPGSGDEVTGCLHVSNHERPSVDGPLIYLGCQGRLDAAIAKVVPGGGKVLMDKHEIAPYGFRAVVVDSEGNRIALHSV